MIDPMPMATTRGNKIHNNQRIAPSSVGSGDVGTIQ